NREVRMILQWSRGVAAAETSAPGRVRPDCAPAFNGAAASPPRKPAKILERAGYQVLLQWSRGVAAAETRVNPTHTGGLDGPSMEPRRRRRGNRRSRCTRCRCGPSFNGAAASPPRKPVVNVDEVPAEYLLQWSRGVAAAETGSPNIYGRFD